MATPAEFDQRYRRVGILLESLAAKRGDVTAARLRTRYFAVPYADALRSDAVRQGADRTLRILIRRLEAELEATETPSSPAR